MLSDGHQQSQKEAPARPVRANRPGGNPDDECDGLISTIGDTDGSARRAIVQSGSNPVTIVQCRSPVPGRDCLAKLAYMANATLASASTGGRTGRRPLPPAWTRSSSSMCCRLRRPYRSRPQGGTHLPLPVGRRGLRVRGLKARQPRRHASRGWLVALPGLSVERAATRPGRAAFADRGDYLLPPRHHRSNRDRRLSSQRFGGRKVAR